MLYAFNWTRLSCHNVTDSQVRLQLLLLAHYYGNLLRRLALCERQFRSAAPGMIVSLAGLWVQLRPSLESIPWSQGIFMRPGC